MRRRTVLLSSLLVLPLLHGCATVRMPGDLGAGPAALQPRLAQTGPTSVLQLWRPAYVAMVVFDLAEARLVYPGTGADPRLPTGTHYLETPRLGGLAGTGTPPCDREGEVRAGSGRYRDPRSEASAAGRDAVINGRTSGRTALRDTPPSGGSVRRVLYNGRQVVCFRPAGWKPAGPRSSLLVVTSEAPLAADLSVRVAEFERSLPGLEKDPERVAAELARRLAPADERAWVARTYEVVGRP